MLAFPRPARRGPLIFLVSVLLIVGILTHRSRFLIGLLFADGYPYVIDPVRLLDAPGAAEESEKQTPLIPQIIHQTYKNTSLPDEWLVSQKSCKKLHPDFKYMVRAPSRTPISHSLPA
jgi:inositol phosphorylceramide mannosyltransferase catalytic subunit